MRYLFLMAGLGACSNPLSNEVFYADNAFLAAFPDAERIGFSSTYARYPRGGTDVLLRAMADEAEFLDPVLSVVTQVGDLLRNTEPSERSSTHRHWATHAFSTPVGAPRELWFLRADITRPAVDADFSWQIEGTLNENGDWVVLGTGTHRDHESGDLEWDLAEMARLLDLEEAPSRLRVRYEMDQEQRAVELSIENMGTLASRDYEFHGDASFTWVGDVLLPDGRIAGAAQVYLDDIGSGRAISVVYPDGTEQIQETCWDLTGATLWATGSLLEPIGAPTACTTADVF